MRIAVIFGTRPEAIKMARGARIAEGQGGGARVEPLVFVTAQHRDLLDQVLSLFEIGVDADLNAMRPGQGLADLTARLMEGLDPLLKRTAPDLVLVHGDTTTALTAALAAYYNRIPVGHVEAGLRTRNRYSPFPEEMNRHLVDALAVHHFAPTEWAAENLRARAWTPGHRGHGQHRDRRPAHDPGASRAPGPRRAPPPPPGGVPGPRAGIRSSCWSPAIAARISATAWRDLPRLVTSRRCFPGIAIIYPVHPNPNVRAATSALLEGRERIYLIDPLDYDAFCYLMAACR